ncbi:MAG: RHS repeat protein, partial [Ignavibacteriae bacterium]|nr:RHS repeat protein [Ignavibacteriota bacterium]
MISIKTSAENTKNPNKVIGLYTLDFSKKLPWQIASLQVPSFHIPHFENQRRREQSIDLSIKPNWQIEIPEVSEETLKKFQTTLESFEFVSHPILDKLVVDLNRNPVAIASFVQNEIALISGISMFGDAKGASTALNPAKIDRNVLHVYLERQGSPWEQCALLVYLLRKAGYSAVYATAPSGKLVMERDRMSNMLGIQLRRALSSLGAWSKLITFQEADLIPVNYPWVMLYDKTKKSWVHLFPWIKNIQVHEGLDFYPLMPKGYQSAAQWIRHYLENDPAIFKHVKLDGNDTAAVLLERFIEEHLRAHGKMLDDIGVRFQNVRQQFATFEQFPRPYRLQGNVSLVTSLIEKSDLFTTVTVQIQSQDDPATRVFSTKPMKTAQIQGRPFYFYATPIADNNFAHDLVIEMLPYGPTNGDIGLFDNDTKIFLKQRHSVYVNHFTQSFVIKIIYEQGNEQDENTSIMAHEAKKTEISYTFAKGVAAAICMNIGRVTPEMLNVLASQFESRRETVNSHERVGILNYLTGMTYYKKLSDAEAFLRRIHKVYNAPLFAAGLSKLSPDLSYGSPNISPQGYFMGEPVLRFPQVDMQLHLIRQIFNNSIRPDYGDDSANVIDPFAQMMIVDGSSNEHQILNDMYQDHYAISTVKLLQLSHKHHNGFLTWTQKQFAGANLNISDDIPRIKKEAQGQWDATAKALGFDLKNNRLDVNNKDSFYAFAYMTPGHVKSENGDYTGMGTLIFSPGSWSALISSNKNYIHGGYGSRLPPQTFHQSNVPNINLERTYDNAFRMGGMSTEANYHQQSYVNPAESYQQSLNQQTMSGYYDYVNQQSVDATLGQVTPNAPFVEAAQQHWHGVQDQRRYEPVAQENVARMLEQIHGFEVPSSSAGESPQMRASHTYEHIHNRGALYPETHPDHQPFLNKVADPVNIVTGTFYIDEVDITLPGVFPLEIRRNYSSANALPGDFGYGWKSSLVSYLVLAENGLIEAAEMDGTVLVYRQKPNDDVWRVYSEDNPQLTNNTSAGIGGLANAFHNRITKSKQDGKVVYTLRGADGSKRIFIVRSFAVEQMSRERPYLVSWQDNRGNELRFIYSETKGENDYGKIRRIESDNGNALSFEYDTAQRVIRAMTIDGRIVRYTYDKQGDLLQVTAADGAVTEYKYEQKIEARKENLVYSTHRLMEQIKPGDRRLINDYDNNGRVVRQRATVGQSTELVVNAIFKYAKSNDKFAMTEVIAPAFDKDKKDSITKYHIYDGLIYRIDDPMGVATYQSWYLSAEQYFDAESVSIKTADASQSKGYQKSLKEVVDKRGLRTSYEYDKNGNAVLVHLTGEDLTGDGVSQSEAKSVYDLNTNLLIETSSQMVNGDVKIAKYFYDRQYHYLPAKI